MVLKNNIKHLNLSECVRLTDFDVKFICNKLPNLIELDLSKCINLTNDGAIMWSQYTPSSLLILKLNKLPSILNDGIKMILANTPSLINLEWKYGQCYGSKHNLNPFNIYPITSFKLNKLDISHSNHLHQIGLDLTGLTIKLSLNLSNCIKLRKCYIKYDNLMMLDISNCILLDTVLIESKQLKSIFAKNCAKIQTFGIISSTVKIANLHCCSNIQKDTLFHDKGFLKLSIHNKKLKSLDLRGMSQLNDDDISNIINLNKNYGNNCLKILSVDMCKNISKNMKTYIKNNFKQFYTKKKHKNSLK